MRQIAAITLFIFLSAILIAPLPAAAGGLKDLKQDLLNKGINGEDRSGTTTTQAPPAAPPTTVAAPPEAPPVTAGNPDCPGGVCPPTNSGDGGNVARGLGRIFGGFLKGIFSFFETLFKGIFGGLQDIFGGGNNNPPVQPPEMPPVQPPVEPPVTPPVTPPTTPPVTPPTTPPVTPPTPPVAPPVTPPTNPEPPKPKPQGVQSLDPANFDSEVVNSKGIYMVDFYATWCGPCKQLAPQLERAASAFASDPNVRVGKIDADRHAQMRAKYGVNGYPTVIIFKDGKPVTKFSGYRSASELQRIVNQYK